MARKASITEADMKRAISAARRGGLNISECRLEGAVFRVICKETDGTTFDHDDRKPKEWGPATP